MSTIVPVGLAAMSEPLDGFEDRLLTDAAAAKVIGVSMANWLDLKKDRPPLSLWASDVSRYAVAHKTTSWRPR